MALLSVIRRWHFREEMPIREIARRTGLSRNTVRKYLAAGVVDPQYSRRKTPSKLDAYELTLTGWLHRESHRSRKQRRSVKQLYGEPTLDSNLVETIELLRPLGYKIAVISNASLVWKTEVQNALHKADWVSLKVDASDDPTWRLINRPHRDLQLDRILDGIKSFANDYQGTLATETMLVQGINDSVASVTSVTDYLEQLAPAASYLAVPTRPTSETDIVPPAERVINQAYQILCDKLHRVELLIGYEGNAFAFTGNAEEDLLSITAVHPMREEAVKIYLLKAGEDWELVLRLIEEGKLQETRYQGSHFYLRCLPNR